MLVFKLILVMFCLALVFVKTSREVGSSLCEIREVYDRVSRVRSYRKSRDAHLKSLLCVLSFVPVAPVFAGTAPKVAVDSSVYSAFQSGDSENLVGVHVKYVPTGGLATAQTIKSLDFVTTVPSNFSFRTQSSGFYDYSVATSERDEAYYVYDSFSDTLYFSYIQPASKFVSLLSSAFESEDFGLDTEVKRLDKVDAVYGRIVSEMVIFPSLDFSSLIGEFVEVSIYIAVALVSVYFGFVVIRKFLTV